MFFCNKSRISQTSELFLQISKKYRNSYGNYYYCHDFATYKTLKTNSFYDVMYTVHIHTLGILQHFQQQIPPP